MEIQNEESGSRYDTPLLLAALLLLIGGMVSFYYFDPQLGKLARLGLLLGTTAAAVFAVSRTSVGATIWSYLQGANIERRKVVWPTRQESVQTTLVIAVFVVIVAVIMWLLDSGLLWTVQKLTGRSA